MLGKWASSILHLFPGSAFEQLNPVSWRSQVDSFTDGSEWLTVPSPCSLVLSSSKANHSLRTRTYTWPAMDRLIWWEDRWTHKHREDKQQPDCIPQYLSLQCSGKTLCQGSLWYLPSQVLGFQISGPQTQSHQPTSPQSFWGLLLESLGHSSIWDSVHAIHQLIYLELCWWDLCCQNRGHIHTESI